MSSSLLLKEPQRHPHHRPLVIPMCRWTSFPKTSALPPCFIPPLPSPTPIYPWPLPPRYSHVQVNRIPNKQAHSLQSGRRGCFVLKFSRNGRCVAPQATDLSHMIKSHYRPVGLQILSPPIERPSIGWLSISSSSSYMTYQFPVLVWLVLFCAPWKVPGVRLCRAG